MVAIQFKGVEGSDILDGNMYTVMLPTDSTIASAKDALKAKRPEVWEQYSKVSVRGLGKPYISDKTTIDSLIALMQNFDGTITLTTYSAGGLKESLDGVTGAVQDMKNSVEKHESESNRRHAESFYRFLCHPDLAIWAKNSLGRLCLAAERHLHVPSRNPIGCSRRIRNSAKNLHTCTRISCRRPSTLRKRT